MLMGGRGSIGFLIAFAIFVLVALAIMKGCEAMFHT
jgi:hypothetical protein